ncbi:MAG: formylglycine-generating enzyme family protein [Methanolobus sp.]
MNKRVYLTLIMSLILMLAVFASGCSDSGEAVTEEENTGTDNVAGTADDAGTEEEQTADDTFSNSVGMDFVKIPAGTFTMGAPEEESYSDKDERPTHEVTISNEYYIGAYEVTQEQWEAVMGENPSKFTGSNLPVEKVSWADANNFVEQLNEVEGTDTYRLPTEAEWEYAARAGTSTAYSFGDDPAMLISYGWFDDNSEDRTRPVGMKEANPWGLYDVHGNVAEWVMDQYHSNYQKAPVDGSEWMDGVDRRIIRGGSWDNAEANCRSAHREDLGEGSRTDYVGLRIVKEI